MHHIFFAGISWFRVQSQQNLRKWLYWECIQYASQQKLPEEDHPIICIFHRKSFRIEFVNVYEKKNMSILFTSIFNDSYVTLFWGVIIGIMSIWVCPSFVPCPLLFIEKSLVAHTWKVWCDPDLRPLDKSKCHIVINKVSFKILLLAMKHMIISLFFYWGWGGESLTLPG